MGNNKTSDHFQAIADKMRSADIPDIAIANFKTLYQQLIEGNSGCIPESSIQTVQGLPDIDELDQHYLEAGKAVLPKTVLLKLNGGLGTSMGLDKAKSLITIKQHYSFLDIIAQHAIYSQVHLLLMNSFSTREDSRNVLKKYPLPNKAKLAFDFIQHKVPKINQHDFAPAIHPDNEHLEWYPPGHGDIFIALVSSGMLKELLNADYRYALISNADNLGAVLDNKLLGYLVEQQIPFLMEVTDRTAADKKGGHLARLLDGRLMLRESAQCTEENRKDFEDIQKHRYFNTNNLWIDLQQLQDTLDKNNNMLNLPLIRNSKTIDPAKSNSSPVYQLETAMGTAISVFEGAQAIRVSRKRFAPVKTTDDLLLVRSDVYELNENYTLSSKLACIDIPLINLDSNYYKLIDDFESRFPYGPPSLLECQRFDVRGDIIFGNNVTIKGKICLHNKSNLQISIPANTRIDKDISWE